MAEQRDCLDYYSDCSASESYESSDSFSDDEQNFMPWLEKVGPRGDLFYIEKEFLFPVESNSLNSMPHPNPTTVKSSKLVEKFRKLMTKYKHREWKSDKLKENLETKDIFNPHSFISQEVYIDVNTSRQSIGRKVTLSDELLGLKLAPVELTNIDMADKIKILGFVSDKEVPGVKPGDWLHSINDENVYFSNIDNILKKLDLPTKVKLTILSPCQNSSELDYFSTKHYFVAEELLGKYDVVGEIKSLFKNLPHGVLFLKTSNLFEDDVAINEAVIYKYPDENCALFLLKGMFITVNHIIAEFTSAPVLGCNVDVKGQRMYVGFFKENNITLLFGVPLSSATALEIQHIVRNVGKVLKFQNFLNDKEFLLPDSINQMDKFFSMFFKYFLPDHSGNSNLCQPLLYDILPSVPWLPLPLELKTEINDVLTELESSDFGNSSDGFCKKQRIYSILGSCLFYKGYLLSSHFLKDDLLDVYLFLRYNYLFVLTKVQAVSRIIIWKEVFPRYNHQYFNDSEFEKSEHRCFLLTIAMNCTVLSILLESGGCAMQVGDNTPPDSFYIEEAQNTLIILHSCGIISAVEKIFQVCHRSLTSPDMLQKRDLSCWNSPSTILSSSTNSLNAIGVAGSSNIYDREKESDPDSDCSDTSNEMVQNLGSSTNISILTRSTSDSQESNDYLNYMLQKTNISEGSNFISAFDQISRAVECGNTVFQYLHVDPIEGIFLAPFHKELNFHQGSIYDAVLINFHRYCIKMRGTFAKSLRNKEVIESKTNTKFGVNKFLCSAYEQGILFSHVLKENNKQRNSFNFWIVGRLFFTPQAREVYVCYHDSIQQDMVEIAFKLGFGLLL